LIAKVADRAGLSKKDSEKAINAFIDTVSDSLKAGQKVSVVGFGTFEVRERAARKGRNPQTGKEIEIPASRSPAFKAGKTLKDAIG
jgi:DNA-binding protein HU-beta